VLGFVDSVEDWAMDPDSEEALHKRPSGETICGYCGRGHGNDVMRAVRCCGEPYQPAHPLWDADVHGFTIYHRSICCGMALEYPEPNFTQHDIQPCWKCSPQEDED
jgi:hypothetical protein